MTENSDIIVPPNPVDEAIHDPKVSDEQLGALLRMYRGTQAPATIVIVRPSWWEKSILLAVLALLGVIAATFGYTTVDRHNQGDKIRGNQDTILYVQCVEMRQLHLILPNECPAEAKQ